MSETNPKNNQKSTLTKEQLENRLYDQGFTHYTMPSVVRHNNSQLQKIPLVARLYSLNNNLIKSVKQPQTSILYNKKPRDHSENVKMKQVYETQMNFGYTNPANFQFNQEQKTEQKKTKLDVLKVKQRKDFQNGQNRQINEQDFKQTKIVMDKLRHTYLEKTKCYRQIEKPIEQPVELQKQALIRKSIEKTEEISGILQNKRFESELDTYIRLLSKNSPNIDEFVYLIQNPNSDDPYDLILRNYFQISHQKNNNKKLKSLPLKHLQNEIKQSDYYTISLKGLCRCKEGRPVEFITLTDWLKERETYDKIRNLGFFADFLKWKTVKLWRKSYNSFKKKIAMKNLEEKLFINYPELKDAIFKTKKILFSMSQLICLDLNFNVENNSESIQIQEFVILQENKASQTQNQIKQFAKDCSDTYSESLKARLEKLKIDAAENNETDNILKNNTNEKFVQVKENPYESLGFPETMSYDKRSVLRKECYRFIKFANFIDFLAIDTLLKVYINSVNLFIKEISDISNVKNPNILRELDKTKQMGSRNALFKIHITPKLNYQNANSELQIEEEKVPDFKYPKISDDQLKPSDFKDFNILTHPFLIKYEENEEFNVQKKKQLEYGDNQNFVQQKLINVEKVCLNLQPPLNKFIEELDKILLESTQCFQVFLSLAKNPQMKQYYAVLEEWDDHQESQEQGLENNVLNPLESIEGDARQQLEKKVKTIFQEEFHKAEKYLSEFREFLQYDWEYENLNYEVLQSNNLAKPAPTFNSIFNLLNYQKQLFETKIPYMADLGLFRVESKDIKMLLMEKPGQIEEIIYNKMLEQLKTRFKEAKIWFQESIEKLQLTADSIDKFIQQIYNIEEIDKKFEYYKDLVKTSKELIETFKKFHSEFPKDIQILYTDCKSLEQNLTSQKSAVDANITKNKEGFIKEIEDVSIPNLQKQCEELEVVLANPKYLDIQQENVLEELEAFKSTIKSYETKSDNLNEYKQVLGQETTKFKKIKEISEDLNVKILLRTSYKEWYDLIENWKSTTFVLIDIESIQSHTDKHQRNVGKCRKFIPMTNKLLSQLDEDIKSFQQLLPIVGALRNEKLNKNHLLEIEKMVDQKLDFKTMNLNDFLSPNILQQQKKIIGISVQVSEEFKLKEKLNGIEKKFGELVFPLVPFKEDNPKDSTYILGDCTDLLNEVDLLIMTINQIYGSRYLNEYKKITADKRKDILMLQEVLMEWLKFQKSYIYLESIFSQPEMKKPLQLEGKEFEDQVNKQYKSNIKKIIGVQSIAQLTKQKFIETLLQNFKKQNIKLHELNQKINDFLDSKREDFPRFYFVANDELIHILANYDSPKAVQGFIGKLFENVNKLDFGVDPRSLSFQRIISREEEPLELKGPINIKTNGVEKWLNSLEEYMIESLFRAIKQGLNNFQDQSKDDWYLKNIAQVTSVITQYAWTVNTEILLTNLEEEDGNDLHQGVSENQGNLDVLVKLVRRPNLTLAQQRSIVALITCEVHNRDILEEMIEKNVENINEFLWQQQLRYYFEEHTDLKNALIIKQINSVQYYGYEYYGPCSRIVITPLTDKCWITITSALNMKLGAAPQGPAGTGKTESTKDLAKCLGRFCLVFNCSDQIDYKMMEKLFRGIIQQGAWTCLDEFNRIDIEVLSVIAQQLLELRLALLKHKTGDEFFFGGFKCKLIDSCGVFITMNPGYAGRTELPDNLKALFRPVSMMIPDYALIAQILLFSEGFSESKILAAKMIKLYKLASEQLSQQKHYDFGMRAVKSVLEMAGRLKRLQPEENENFLLIRALKDSNIPKFLKEDLPLFNALIQDLFPNVELPETDNQQLLSECDIYLQNNILETCSQFKEKVSQLYETLNVRFGTMVVGTAMTGKSTIINSLKASLNQLFNKNQKLEDEKKNKKLYLVENVTINPKSVTMGELYGEESVNKDWIDGLASHYIRIATQDESPNQKWISFDGPVDALWIENMNSVLDDSRILCLSNGQRIRLNNNMRIIFEVDTLEQASPATVSRCGMVFVSGEVLNWKNFTESWLKKFALKNQQKNILTEKCFELMKELFENNIQSLIEYQRTLSKVIDIVDFQSIRATCNILDSILCEEYGLNPDKNEESKLIFINLAFAFALAWGFGASLSDKESEKIDNMIKKKFATVDFLADSITNCFIDSIELKFSLYSQKIEKYSFDLNTSFWELLVPTVDTIKLSHIIGLHFDSNRSVFLTGCSGTGKSVLATKLLKNFYTEKNIDTLKFNFSAQTNSKSVQETILSGLFLLSQKSRGAKFGRKNVIYVDDVNMPAKEIYGAQPPIELLRQFFDFGFLYDLKEKNPITIQDSCFLCLAAPPEGGRNKLSPRFVRHFNVLCFPNARNTTISRIFISLLDGFLKPFDDVIKNKSHDIVNASIEFYEKICIERLPTPTKFHYTFNLRDLSKVFMGLSMAKPQVITTPLHLVRLWGHELSRVFYDRLNSQEDRQWFYQSVEMICESYLAIRAKELDLTTTLFSEIFSIQDEITIYEEIKDQEKLVKVLNDFQLDYNDRNRNKLNLVFFNQAVYHFLRILRILKQPRGNALLVGVGGLGKSSLTRIACFITDYIFKQMQQTAHFNEDSFKEWLRKEIIQESGGPEKGDKIKPICLLLADSNIKDDLILEDINNLLNSGEVPNIFPKDDKEKIQKGIIDLYATKQITLEITEAWKIFVERVRNNLHIIMCMSPVGESLKIWCRQFPAIVNCCTIDWFENWQGSALESVSQRLLFDKNFQNLEELCVQIKIFHQKACETAEIFQREMKRKFYITPKTCLDNINLFIKFLDEKKKELEERIDGFQKGSVKLEEMAVIVEKLQKELTEAQPLLEEQSKLASEKLIQLEKASKIANDKKMKVEEEAAIIQVKKEQIEEINNQANEKLKDAIPKIQKAENEVRNIDRKELNNLRSLPTPHKMIEFILQTVCIVLEEKFVNWKESGRKLLNDLNKFIEKLIKKIDSIKENGSEAVSSSILTKLKKNLDHEYFGEKKLKTNIIARPLGMWCHAIYDFAILKKDIEPLEKNAKEMKEKLTEAEKEYNEIAEDLRICKEEFTKLENEFNEMDQKKKALEDSIFNSKIKLGRAEKLTFLLSEEGMRWKESVELLLKEKKTLIGDIFLSAAQVSYLGPLSSIYRKNLVDKWMKELSQTKNIEMRPEYNFLEIMGDPLQLKQWSVQGLPSDEVSQSSGLSSMLTQKWPFLIDPQLQAKKWLINILSTQENFLLIQQDLAPRKFIESFKTALSNGYQVLYEDCQETLNGVLDTVIERAYFVNQMDQQVLITFNDENIIYQEDFKLFMTTKLSNPNFLPDIFIRTCVINFTVTQKGLEDQLLAEVMKLEKPEDEKLKNENIEKISEYQIKMKEIEKRILQLLVQCEKSPVEDENLVQTLEYSKKTSKEIKEKMQSIESISKELSKTREVYRTVATIGSILFFVVTDISQIDPMYQYSLQAIIKLFKQAIKNTCENGIERIEKIKSNITKLIYTNVSRGVFESHKMILSFLISINFKLKNGLLDPKKWELFLKGCGVIERENQPPNPDPTFINEFNWDLLNVLEQNFESFKGVIESTTKNLQIWKKITNGKIFDETFPQPFDQNFDNFDKMLITKVFKAEKLLENINEFIIKEMGEYYLGNFEIKPEQIFDESDNQTPIIFILSKGADPSNEIKKLGENKGFRLYEKLLPISLGQGQGERAARLIEQGKELGFWILLENCHLARTWMPELEKKVEALSNLQNSNQIHKEFRLFLTSMPADYFPVSILQNSMKITTEPPRGIKSNLLRSMNGLDEEYFDQVQLKEVFAKLTIGLCFFHAVVQERRKFGPLGWNISYEFNDSDLLAAKDILRMFLQEKEDKQFIPWDSILFLTGLITYGGRVTDDLDRRLLFTTLKKFYCVNILNERYKLCPLEVYKLPKKSGVKCFVEFIQTLPTFDSPEIFGLHSNANITYQNQEAEKIMQTVTMVMPKSSETSDENQSTQKVKEIIQQFLNPQNGFICLKFEDGHKDHFKIEANGLIPSLSTVLLQEIARFNILVNKIKFTLENLELAIEGKISMSADLDEIFNTLLNNQVPNSWKEVAYPSLKPLSSWFKNLQERIAFVSSWMNEGNISCYWLPGLFFPQGFLTGVLQTHARKLNEPIDKFSFTFKATDYKKNQKGIPMPEDGVYISGLYLEGAHWDLKKKGIVDSLPNQMFFEMPVIHFIPKESNDFKGSLYSCPLYKTLFRAGTLSTTGQSTNFILEVQLPCDKTPDFWVMRGVALFCELKN